MKPSIHITALAIYQLDKGLSGAFDWEYFDQCLIIAINLMLLS